MFVFVAMGEEFKTFIKDFSEKLLNPENIVPKYLHGDLLKCSELGKEISSFDVSAGDRFVQVESLCQVNFSFVNAYLV